MNSKKITNIGEPINDNDVVTKKYITEQLSQLNLIPFLHPEVNKRLSYISLIYEFKPVVWFSHIDLQFPVNRAATPRSLCLVNSAYKVIGSSPIIR